MIGGDCPRNQLCVRGLVNWWQMMLITFLFFWTPSPASPNASPPPPLPSLSPRPLLRGPRHLLNCVSFLTPHTPLSSNTPHVFYPLVMSPYRPLPLPSLSPTFLSAISIPLPSCRLYPLPPCHLHLGLLFIDTAGVALEEFVNLTVLLAGVWTSPCVLPLLCRPLFLLPFPIVLCPSCVS